MKNTFKSFILLLLISALLISFNFSVLANDKLAPEEIIAKNLDSIGSKEKRAEMKNLVVLCNLQFAFQGSATALSGQAVIASEGEKALWGMTLNSNDYPMDRFSFNGKDAKVGYTVPGKRSYLGEFIYNYKELLRDGLLGGTLSSSWALNYSDARKPKLSFEGEKKIKGKDTYVLSYSPKKGSDLSIKMFFDKQTFQHVRTEYRRVVGAAQSTAGGQSDSRIDATAGVGSDQYSLTEDFSDFQAINGLTLPKTYTISYTFYSDTVNKSTSQQKKNVTVDWKFNITNASINQQLDESSFEIDGK